MRRQAVFVALFFLSLFTTGVLSAPQCDQESTLAASHLRRARASHNSMIRSAADEKCRLVLAQFVEAVAAREAAATCQDSASRQIALKLIDAEIATFNDRIAEQSCVQ